MSKTSRGSQGDDRSKTTQDQPDYYWSDQDDDDDDNDDDDDADENNLIILVMCVFHCITDKCSKSMLSPCVHCGTMIWPQDCFLSRYSEACLFWSS